LAAFEGQQFFFDGKASAVSGEFAVAADDAVARNDDWNGVGAIGEADSAGGVGVPDAVGKLSVGNGFAEGNVEQMAPNFALKFGALRSQWKIEGFEFASEVGAQLADDFFQRASIFLPRRVRRLGTFARHEVNAAKTGIVSGEDEGSDGAIDLGERDHDFLVAASAEADSFSLRLITRRLHARLISAAAARVGGRACPSLHYVACRPSFDGFV